MRSLAWFIDWLNQNDGATIAVLTAVYVAATVGLVRLGSNQIKTPLLKSFNRNPCVFTTGAITFLPPGEELTDAIAGRVDFKTAGLPQRYEIVTSYSDGDGESHSERHVIDLSTTAERSFVRDEPLGKKLDTLNNTLESIARELARRTADQASDPPAEPLN